MEDKLGLFICTGYGIDKAIDVEAMCQVAREELQILFCETVGSCEGGDLEHIYEQIETKGLNKVLIAGVSPRQFESSRFPDNVVVEPLGLREQVVWCQPDDDEDTQMLAEDYLRMYASKLKKTRTLVPYLPEEEVERSVLVVGGGIAGITATLEAARAGYQVRLVEKSAVLGGWLGKQHKSVPTRAPFEELEAPEIDDLICEIESNPLVTVHTSAVPGKISGSPGMFDVTLKSSGNGPGESGPLSTFRVGSIIQATGWEPNDPRHELPYGELEDVIRNVDLERMVREEGKISRPSDGEDVKSIAFVQCTGHVGRDRPSYCSSICCLTSLKQALYLRQFSPESKAYIFYEFMRTPGLYEDFYKKVQRDPGVFLTRGQVTDIKLDEGGKLCLSARDTMIGERIGVKVDLVVLASEMIPNSADGERIREFEDAKLMAQRGESEVQRKEASETVELLKTFENTEILNLDYRQGPDLPILEDGFPDSHFICFPYETRRTGIYSTGCLREPMDGLGSRDDAAGAALKAIQCIEMTARGESVHPRAGDRSVPDFFLQRCTKCKRCTEECPFGVLNEDEKGTPLLSTTRCRRCGTCMGACPERIVSFGDYSVDLVASMIKAVHVPDEFEEKPRILVLACENDAVPAIEMAGYHQLRFSPFVRIVPVRCLGSVNSVWVTEAMSAGYDGVIMLGCRYGEDYQCHFIKGSELAASREKNVREKLEQMAMEHERVELHQLQISEYYRIPEIFAKFEELLEDIGMNPFKDM